MLDVDLNLKSKGDEMFGWAENLFPICRSLTGQGVRDTLYYFKSLLPALEIFEVESGTKVFDWEIPNEWNITEAYIMDESGKKVIDFEKNNLHVVGYSEAVDEWLDLEDLERRLHSLEDQPDAIPYITSYYHQTWGFCLSHNKRKLLQPGRYRAVIKSELKSGVLNYGELRISGKSKKEVFLSSYVCHPSMANNELSGPVVLVALAQWLQKNKSLNYSYRIVLIPETIGSITYLSKHLEFLKKQVVAGFNVSCVGDERCYSYVSSRSGVNLADSIVKHVLRNTDINFKAYSWLDRGSDERQYCAPGVDLPVVGFSRSKYGEYPEYHTSLDNLDLISAEGLAGSYLALQRMIEVIEKNEKYKSTILCEPQLGKRGLYPSFSKKGSTVKIKPMMNLISYCDGEKSLLEIADLISVPFWELIVIAEQLLTHGLLETEKA